MKTSTLRFGLPSGITFTHFSILLILPLMFSSCMDEFQASVDLSKRRYKDKEFKDPDANKLDAAANLGMMTILYLNTGDAEGNRSSASKEETDLLWASTDAFTFSQESSPSQHLHKKPLPQFLEGMYLYTGIQYIGRRSKEGLVKSALHYLEVPLYAMVERDLGKGQIFGGLGPYIGFGIGGKTKIKFAGTTTKSDSFGEDGFRRFDAGLNWTIGYRLENELALRLGYDIGLLNIAREEDLYKEWNRTISINVSYPIEKIKEKVGI